MTAAKIDPGILKQDLLGRDVLSRKDQRKLKKGVTLPALFMDNVSPFELSVNRLTPNPGEMPPADRPDLVSDTVMAKISDRRAKALGRTFYCWAALSVADAEQDSRIVRPAPLPGNEQHANIHLPDEARKDELIRRDHAHNLAKKAKWRARPAAKPRP